MKSFICFCFIVLFLVSSCASSKKTADGWISLFDGKSLDDWKVGKNAGTFAVENGTIVVNGEVAHLFYMGEIKRLINWIKLRRL